MESHYFTEPIPVEPEGKDAALPTWRVEVIRQSTTDSVGTLLISNENLPPRKNKKKILWKLPDNTESNPTFGEHEKKRLWELFKQQKKDRKKQALLEKVQEDEENTTEANGEKPVLSVFNGATTTAPSSGENGRDEKASATSTNTRRSPVTVTANNSESERSPPLNSVRPPPPPPGFDMAARLRAQPPPPPPPPGLSATTTATTAMPSTSSTNASAAPPLGLSAATTAMPSATTRAAAAAPPPGLPVTTTTTAMPSTSRAALFHAATNKTAQTVTSTSRYPTGVTASLLPSPQQREQQQNQQQQQPSFFGPPRYFRKALNEPATALAQQVVACFLNTMTCATPGVSSTTWLQYYSAETAVTKTLLIGSAQAVCRTPQDCLQQVRSLSMPGESIWECHGYTIQPTCTSTTTTAKRFSNVTGANAAQSHLLIMTGRTIQKGESLAYNLTLVLKPTEQVTPPGATAAATTNAADSDATVYYQIQNDVLSLFAVNVSATSSASSPIPC
jgi:hypothetical protein